MVFSASGNCARRVLETVVNELEKVLGAAGEVGDELQSTAFVRKDQHLNYRGFQAVTVQMTETPHSCCWTTTRSSICRLTSVLIGMRTPPCLGTLRCRTP